jgi:hypothetical protein
MTAVLAIPLPVTELLETSTKAITESLIKPNSKVTRLLPFKKRKIITGLKETDIEALGRDSSLHDLSNMKSKNLPVRQLGSNLEKEFESISRRDLELQIWIAKLNALNAEMESSTSSLEIDEVNELWNKHMNEGEVTPLKTKLVTFSPTV